MSFNSSATVYVLCKSSSLWGLKLIWRIKKKAGFWKEEGTCPLLFKTFSQLSSRVYGSKCLNVTKHLLVPKPNQGVKDKVKSVWDSELSDKKSGLSAKRNGQTSGKSQTHGS